jgi:hypothetical protein
LLGSVPSASERFFDFLSGTWHLAAGDSILLLMFASLGEALISSPPPWCCSCSSWATTLMPIPQTSINFTKGIGRSFEMTSNLELYRLLTLLPTPI